MSVADRVDELLSHLDAPGMPGAAVAVLVDGEVLHRRGYGHADIDAGVPFTPETPFAIASMTKQFTTTCILLLEEDGRLSLEDDYRTYLPEMPDFGAPVTIEHLCTNTSGIRDIFALVAMSGGDRLAPRTRSLVAEMIGRQRTLNFPTGSQYRYSNPNFSMLSWIVERITGQRFAAFVAERIFEPLMMRHSAVQDLRDPPRVGGARAYDGADATTLGLSRWEAFSRSGSGEGGGAIWSTLDDLIRWERNFDCNAIGSARLLERLSRAPQIPGGDESLYGRGLMVGSYRGVPWQGHSGAFGSACCCNRLRLPDRRLSVIILSNSALVDPILDVFDVADVMLDEDLLLEPAPTFVETPAADLEPWFGSYEHPDSGLSFGLTGGDGRAKVVSFGAETRLETAAPGVYLAGRGGSLPTRVAVGPKRPDPQVTITLGPNPHLRLARSPAPAGALARFEGEYVSEELGAHHVIELHGDRLTVTIKGPLGQREGLPLERATTNSFIAAYDDEQRALYRFSNEPGRAPAEVMVSIARAEQVRFRRAQRPTR